MPLRGSVFLRDPRAASPVSGSWDGERLRLLLSGPACFRLTDAKGSNGEPVEVEVPDASVDVVTARLSADGTSLEGLVAGSATPAASSGYRIVGQRVASVVPAASGSSGSDACVDGTAGHLVAALRSLQLRLAQVAASAVSCVGSYHRDRPPCSLSEAPQLRLHTRIFELAGCSRGRDGAAPNISAGLEHLRSALLTLPLAGYTSTALDPILAGLRQALLPSTSKDGAAASGSSAAASGSSAAPLDEPASVIVAAPSEASLSPLDALTLFGSLAEIDVFRRACSKDAAAAGAAPASVAPGALGVSVAMAVDKGGAGALEPAPPATTPDGNSAELPGGDVAMGGPSDAAGAAPLDSPAAPAHAAPQPAGRAIKPSATRAAAQRAHNSPRMKWAMEWLHAHMHNEDVQILARGFRPEVVRAFLPALAPPRLTTGSPFSDPEAVITALCRTSPAMPTAATDALTSLVVMTAGADAGSLPEPLRSEAEAAGTQRGIEALDAYCLARMVAGDVPAREGSSVTPTKARTIARALKRARGADAVAARIALAGAMLHHCTAPDAALLPAAAAHAFIRGAGAIDAPGEAWIPPADLQTSLDLVTEIWVHASSGAAKLREVADARLGTDIPGATKARAVAVVARRRATFLLAVLPREENAPFFSASPRTASELAAVCTTVSHFCELDQIVVATARKGKAHAAEPASGGTDAAATDVSAHAASDDPLASLLDVDWLSALRIIMLDRAAAQFCRALGTSHMRALLESSANGPAAASDPTFAAAVMCRISQADQSNGDFPLITSCGGYIDINNLRLSARRAACALLMRLASTRDAGLASPDGSRLPAYATRVPVDPTAGDLILSLVCSLSMEGRERGLGHEESVAVAQAASAALRWALAVDVAIARRTALMQLPHALLASAQAALAPVAPSDASSSSLRAVFDAAPEVRPWDTISASSVRAAALLLAAILAAETSERTGAGDEPSGSWARSAACEASVAAATRALGPVLDVQREALVTARDLLLDHATGRLPAVLVPLADPASCFPATPTPALVASFAAYRGIPLTMLALGGSGVPFLPLESKLELQAYTAASQLQFNALAHETERRQLYRALATPQWLCLLLSLIAPQRALPLFNGSDPGAVGSPEVLAALTGNLNAATSPRIARRCARLLQRLLLSVTPAALDACADGAVIQESGGVSLPASVWLGRYDRVGTASTHATAAEAALQGVREATSAALVVVQGAAEGVSASGASAEDEGDVELAPPSPSSSAPARFSPGGFSERFVTALLDVVGRTAGPPTTLPPLASLDVRAELDEVDRALAGETEWLRDVTLHARKLRRYAVDGSRRAAAAERRAQAEAEERARAEAEAATLREAGRAEAEKAKSAREAAERRAALARQEEEDIAMAIRLSEEFNAEAPPNPQAAADASSGGAAASSSESVPSEAAAAVAPALAPAAAPESSSAAASSAPAAAPAAGGSDRRSEEERLGHNMLATGQLDHLMHEEEEDEHHPREEEHYEQEEEDEDEDAMFSRALALSLAEAEAEARRREASAQEAPVDAEAAAPAPAAAPAAVEPSPPDASASLLPAVPASAAAAAVAAAAPLSEVLALLESDVHIDMSGAAAPVNFSPSSDEEGEGHRDDEDEDHDDDGDDDDEEEEGDGEEAEAELDASREARKEELRASREALDHLLRENMARRLSASSSSGESEGQQQPGTAAASASGLNSLLDFGRLSALSAGSSAPAGLRRVGAAPGTAGPGAGWVASVLNSLESDAREMDQNLGIPPGQPRRGFLGRRRRGPATAIDDDEDSDGGVIDGPRACSYCGDNNPHSDRQTCGACLNAHYCNKNCQKAHWKRHMHVCAPMTPSAKAAQAAAGAPAAAGDPPAFAAAAAPLIPTGPPLTEPPPLVDASASLLQPLRLGAAALRALGDEALELRIRGLRAGLLRHMRSLLTAACAAAASHFVHAAPQPGQAVLLARVQFAAIAAATPDEAATTTAGPEFAEQSVQVANAAAAAYGALGVAPPAKAAEASIDQSPAAMAALTAAEAVATLRQLLDITRAPGGADSEDADDHAEGREGSWRRVVSTALRQALGRMEDSHDESLRCAASEHGGSDGYLVTGRMPHAPAEHLALVGRAASAGHLTSCVASRVGTTLAQVVCVVDTGAPSAGGAPAPAASMSSADASEGSVQTPSAPASGLSVASLARLGISPGLLQRVMQAGALVSACVRDAVAARGTGALAVCGGHSDVLRVGSLVRRLDGLPDWNPRYDTEGVDGLPEAHMAREAREAMSLVPVKGLGGAGAHSADAADDEQESAAPSPDVAAPTAAPSPFAAVVVRSRRHKLRYASHWMACMVHYASQHATLALGVAALVASAGTAAPTQAGSGGGAPGAAAPLPSPVASSPSSDSSAFGWGSSAAAPALQPLLTAVRSRALRHPEVLLALITEAPALSQLLAPRLGVTLAGAAAADTAHLLALLLALLHGPQAGTTSANATATAAELLLCRLSAPLLQERRSLAPACVVHRTADVNMYSFLDSIGLERDSDVAPPLLGLAVVSGWPNVLSAAGPQQAVEPAHIAAVPADSHSAVPTCDLLEYRTLQPTLYESPQFAKLQRLLHGARDDLQHGKLPARAAGVSSAPSAARAGQPRPLETISSLRSALPGLEGELIIDAVYPPGSLRMLVPAPLQAPKIVHIVVRYANGTMQTLRAHADTLTVVDPIEVLPSSLPRSLLAALFGLRASPSDASGASAHRRGMLSTLMLRLALPVPPQVREIALANADAVAMFISGNGRVKAGARSTWGTGHVIARPLERAGAELPGGKSPWEPRRNFSAALRRLAVGTVESLLEPVDDADGVGYMQHNADLAPAVIKPMHELVLQPAADSSGSPSAASPALALQRASTVDLVAQRAVARVAAVKALPQLLATPSVAGSLLRGLWAEEDHMAGLERDDDVRAAEVDGEGANRLSHAVRSLFMRGTSHTCVNGLRDLPQVEAAYARTLLAYAGVRQARAQAILARAVVQLHASLAMAEAPRQLLPIDTPAGTSAPTDVHDAPLRFLRALGIPVPAGLEPAVAATAAAAVTDFFRALPPSRAFRDAAAAWAGAALKPVPPPALSAPLDPHEPDEMSDTDGDYRDGSESETSEESERPSSLSDDDEGEDDDGGAGSGEVEMGGGREPSPQASPRSNAAGSSSAPAPSSAAAAPPSGECQLLMDMGFPREHAEFALELLGGALDDAANFLLSHDSEVIAGEIARKKRQAEDAARIAAIRAQARSAVAAESAAMSAGLPAPSSVMAIAAAFAASSAAAAPSAQRSRTTALSALQAMLTGYPEPVPPAVVSARRLVTSLHCILVGKSASGSKAGLSSQEQYEQQCADYLDAMYRKAAAQFREQMRTPEGVKTVLDALAAGIVVFKDGISTGQGKATLAGAAEAYRAGRNETLRLLGALSPSADATTAGKPPGGATLRSGAPAAAPSGGTGAAAAATGEDDSFEFERLELWAQPNVAATAHGTGGLANAATPAPRPHPFHALMANRETALSGMVVDDDDEDGAAPPDAPDSPPTGAAASGGAAWPDGPDPRGPGALTVLAGDASIDHHLRCKSLSGGSTGFATVGCRGVAITSGKWYYEATLRTGGLMQIGWGDSRFLPAGERGEGVGDDAHSWSYDGHRRRKWHGLDFAFGASWAAGDIICVCLDADSRVMYFGVNGSYAPPNGPAFVGFGLGGGLAPAVSMNSGQEVVLNFGSDGAEVRWGSPPSPGRRARTPVRAFAHGPPPGFRPLHYAFAEAPLPLLGRPSAGAYGHAIQCAALRSSALWEACGKPSHSRPGHGFDGLLEDDLARTMVKEAASLGRSGSVLPGNGQSGSDFTHNAVRFYGRGGGYSGLYAGSLDGEVAAVRDRPAVGPFKQRQPLAMPSKAASAPASPPAELSPPPFMGLPSHGLPRSSWTFNGPDGHACVREGLLGAVLAATPGSLQQIQKSALSVDIVDPSDLHLRASVVRGDCAKMLSLPEVPLLPARGAPAAAPATDSSAMAVDEGLPGDAAGRNAAAEGGALIRTYGEAQDAMRASDRRLGMLMRLQGELKGFTALGCGLQWNASASSEAELRSFLLSTADTLVTLYARKAATALLAAHPYLPSPERPLSITTLGLDLRPALPLLATAQPPPPADGMPTGRSGRRRQDGVPGELPGGLDEATAWQVWSASEGLLALVKLMSWRGVSLPEWEVAGLAAIPLQRATARLTRLAAAAAAANPAAAVGSADQPALAPPRPLNHLEPNAAGVVRFEPANGGLVTHPLGLLEAPLRRMLRADAQACAVPTSDALSSPHDGPLATASAHPALCLAALSYVAGEVQLASRREYVIAAWRGQVSMGSGDQPAMPSKTPYLNVDGVPAVISEVLNQQDPEEGGNEAHLAWLPCPDAAVWMSGLLMEAAVCAARTAAAVGPCAAEDAASIDAVAVIAGVPPALATILAAFGAQGASESGACPLLESLPHGREEARRASNCAAPRLALAVRDDGTTLAIAPGGGCVNHELALALANAWAPPMHTGHAGLKERAARMLAGILWEAIDDVRAAQSALDAVASYLDAAPAREMVDAASWARPLHAALSRTVAHRRSALAPYLRALPARRIAEAAVARLQLERTDAPVHSLYLSALLELHAALGTAEALCPPLDDADVLGVALQRAIEAARDELQRLALASPALAPQARASPPLPPSPATESAAGSPAARPSPVAPRPGGPPAAPSAQPALVGTAPSPAAAVAPPAAAAAIDSSALPYPDVSLTAEELGDPPASAAPVSTVDAPWRLVHLGVGFSPQPGAHNGCGDGPLTQVSGSTLGIAPVAGDFGGAQWGGMVLQKPISSAKHLTWLMSSLADPLPAAVGEPPSAAGAGAADGTSSGGLSYDFARAGPVVGLNRTVWEEESRVPLDSDSLDAVDEFNEEEGVCNDYTEHRLRILLQHRPTPRASIVLTATLSAPSPTNSDEPEAEQPQADQPAAAPVVAASPEPAPPSGEGAAASAGAEVAAPPAADAVGREVVDATCEQAIGEVREAAAAGPAPVPVAAPAAAAGPSEEPDPPLDDSDYEYMSGGEHGDEDDDDDGEGSVDSDWGSPTVAPSKVSVRLIRGVHALGLPTEPAFAAPDLHPAATLLEVARSSIQMGATLRLVALGQPLRTRVADESERGRDRLQGSVRVVGTLDLPLYGATVGLDGTLTVQALAADVSARASSGAAGSAVGAYWWSLTLREVELMAGCREQGWDSRFGSGHPWWTPGTVHRFVGESRLEEDASGGLATFVSPTAGEAPWVPVDPAVLDPLAAAGRAGPSPLLRVLQCVPWPAHLDGGYSLLLHPGDELELTLTIKSVDEAGTGDSSGATATSSSSSDSGAPAAAGADAVVAAPPPVQETHVVTVRYGLDPVLQLPPGISLAVTAREILSAVQGELGPCSATQEPARMHVSADCSRRQLVTLHRDAAGVRAPLAIRGRAVLSRSVLFTLDHAACSRKLRLEQSDEMKRQLPPHLRGFGDQSLNQAPGWVPMLCQEQHGHSAYVPDLSGTYARRLAADGGGSAGALDLERWMLPLLDDGRPLRLQGSDAYGTFDDRHDSTDSATRAVGARFADAVSTVSSSENRTLVVGSTGFSSGVHYWEVHIKGGAGEQGGVMIGVAERRSLPQLSSAASVEAAASLPSSSSGGIPSFATSKFTLRERYSEAAFRMRERDALPHHSLPGAFNSALWAGRKGELISSSVHSVRVPAQPPTSHAPVVLDQFALGTCETGSKHGWGMASFRAAVHGGMEVVYGEFLNAGDVVGVRLDADAGALSFFVDGIKFGEHTLVDAGPAFSELDVSGHSRFAGSATSSRDYASGTLSMSRLAQERGRGLLGTTGASSGGGEGGSSAHTAPSFGGARRVLFPCIALRRSSDKVRLAHKWLSVPGPGTDVAILGQLRTAEVVTSVLACWADGVWPAAEAPAPAAPSSDSPSLMDVEDAPAPGGAAAPTPPLHAPSYRVAGSDGSGWNGLARAAVTRVVREAYAMWCRQTQVAPGTCSPCSQRFTRVRARGGMFVELDTAQVSLERTLRAGGSAPLPPLAVGRDVRMLASYGRSLDKPETATVLGTYRGCVWYRLRRDPSSSSDVAASEAAWYWTPEELAGLKVADEPPRQAAGPAGSAQAGAGSASDDNLLLAMALASLGGIAPNLSERAFAAAAGVALPLSVSASASSDAAASAGAISFAGVSIRDGWLVGVLNAATAAAGCEPINVNWSHIIQAAVAAASLPGPMATDPARMIAWVTAVLARSCLLLALNRAVASVLPMAALSDSDDPGAAFPGLGCGAGGAGIASAAGWHSSLLTALVNSARVTEPQPNAEGSTAGAAAALELDATAVEAALASHACDRWTSSRSRMGLGPAIRSHAALLLTATKAASLEAAMGATTTYTAPHQDEFEMPAEVKSVRITRGPRVQPAALARSGATATARLAASVTGQLFAALRDWDDGALRRSYLGKGHGGQRRAFKVEFVDEGVQDHGGPYRELLEAVFAELQTEAPRPLGDSAPMLLPLLTPVSASSPGGSGGAGGVAVGGHSAAADTFTLSPTALGQLGTSMRNHYAFIGRLMGMGLRHGVHAPLALAPHVWASILAQLRPGGSGLEMPRATAPIRGSLGPQVQLPQPSSGGEALNADAGDDGASPALLPFTTRISDGRTVSLLPRGDRLLARPGTSVESLLRSLASSVQLHESDIGATALAHGLGAVVPAELLALLTGGELASLVAGTPDVSVGALKAATDLEAPLSDSEPVVQWLWEVLSESEPADRVAFLRFVTGRSRLPASKERLGVPLRINLDQRSSSAPDRHMPSAQTCFNVLSLPRYTAKEVLRGRLLTAVHHSPTMDADVALHSAESWAQA